MIFNYVVIHINQYFAAATVECKRPIDGYYNGDVVRGDHGVCLEWEHVLFSGQYEISQVTETLFAISSFPNGDSWEDLGQKCRYKLYLFLQKEVDVE